MSAVTPDPVIQAPGPLQRAVVPVLAVLAGVGLYLAWNTVANWLQYHFGFRSGDGNGPYYLFWSGSGSDLGYWSFVAAAVIYYRKSNCKRKLCWRIGHHDLTDPADGVTRKLCWRHHPAVVHKHLSDAVILRIHEKAVAAQQLADKQAIVLTDIHRHVSGWRSG